MTALLTEMYSLVDDARVLEEFALNWKVTRMMP